MIIEKKFVISSDGENFSDEYETREDAIEECLALYVDGSIFYVGERFNHKASDFFCPEEFIECLMESAHGEYIGLEFEWLKYVGGESIKSLNDSISEVLDKWAVETDNKPDFYGVKNCVKYRKVHTKAEEIKS